MAKFLEVPQKPATVEAVQFTGIEDQVPMFNEVMPKWLFSAFLGGELSQNDNGTLDLHGRAVVPGSWIIHHGGGVLSSCNGVDFAALYRAARKKPVRKPKVQLNVAAE